MEPVRISTSLKIEKPSVVISPPETPDDNLKIEPYETFTTEDWNEGARWQGYT